MTNQDTNAVLTLSASTAIDHQSKDDGQARTGPDSNRDVLESNAKSDPNANTDDDAKRQRPLS